MKLFNYNEITRKLSPASVLFWKDFAREFSAAQAMLNQGQAKGFADWPSFALEIFHRLYYDANPEQLDPQPPEGDWAAKLHEEFTNLPEFESLVRRCEDKPFESGIGTIEACNVLLERLPDPPEAMQENIEELRDRVKALKQQLNQRRESGIGNRESQKRIDNDSLVKQQIQALQQQGKAAVGQAQEYAASLDETQIRSIERAAIGGANKVLDAFENATSCMGWGNEPGNPRQLSIAKKLELAGELKDNQNLQRILSLAGRMLQTAELKRRSKEVEGYGELAGITTGNNLPRLLPSELQKLAVPELQPLFILGYLERTLLEYKFTDKDNLSQGPIILCIDISGSMSGLPDEWAKALALVFATLARQDKRHFRVIQFSDCVDQIDDFPPDSPDFEELLALITGYYSGGGTDFQAPLEEALQCLEQTPELKRADIIFITDGECWLSHKFQENFAAQKETLEFSCYGMLVNSRNTKSLAKFCDRVWAVKNLQGAGEIEEIFGLGKGVGSRE